MDDDRLKWWDAWWTEDYSWNGLLHLHTVATGEKTTQSLADYWLTPPGGGELRGFDRLIEEGELWAEDGRDPSKVFHIAHLPPRLANGRETWKADPNDQQWNRLREIIDARVKNGMPTPGTPGHPAGAGSDRLRWMPNGADKRAVLTGCVIDGLRLTGTNDAPSHVTGTRIAFTGPVNLNSVCLGIGFSIEDSLFEKEFFARGCSSTGPVLLSGNLHEGPVSLHRSILEHALYCPEGVYRGYFDASNLQCRHEGNFGAAIFRDAATFLNARFALTATFTKSQFKNGANFHNVIFQERLQFDEVNVIGRLVFTASTVDKVSTFDRLTLDAASPVDWHGAFDRTTFAGSTDFRGMGLSHVAALDGARIQGGARFDEVSEGDVKVVIADAISMATKAAEADAATSAPGVSGVHRKEKARKPRNKRLRQVEGGVRALKQLSIQSDHRFQATLLTCFELAIRRAQTDVSASERAVSKIYAMTSSYGVSLRRPIAWLAALMVVMAAVFGAILSQDELIGGDAEFNGGKAVAAATLSLGNVFVPFGAWTSKALPQPFAEMTEGWLLTVRVLSTTQSLAAVALLFLFGLAIRKRFHVQ